ncbi:MAG TPA: pyridoxamine 5'-phosphate oxidase family protein [Mucilaginibacter sp.]|jgi:general stress protein 26|nr:pyridoxamine 5'-phosphate oxidase family protein [Mucilaginibacter sp.]
MKDDVYKLISQCKLAVVSTIKHSGKPESALVGIAVTPDLEIIFDTVKSSRKYQNLLQNPHVALVIGWDNETTVQYEGKAELLTDQASDHYREVYYSVWPDGRERAASWPGLVYFKISPRWLRYSNFNDPVTIEEMNF